MAATAKPDGKRSRHCRGQKSGRIGADRFGEAATFARLLRALLRTDAGDGPKRGNEECAGAIKDRACQPDHADKRTLFDLLDAERSIDIKLTESYAMHPAASVSGFYFSHPEAKYFGVGQIGRDQVLDYAQRRGEPVAAVEKRLGQNLGYEANP